MEPPKTLHPIQKENSAEKSKSIIQPSKLSSSFSEKGGLDPIQEVEDDPINEIEEVKMDKV